ncbi:type I-C CRISPR-associated protein Cas8c/Csd1 [Desulfovibrio sp. JY]|nr:type I-C CRISPR-associated protein Cas8c/Csd1 [Desulfovibrio sp. JY]
MSWMQKLFETYEACASNSDYTEPPQAEDGGKEAPTLMPVSHTSQQAHICVTLDSEGNFKRAELMPLKAQLIIPATEGSAGRAGAKVAPHPLIDKIHYCARDYKGKKAETFKGGFEAYFELLTKWSESEFTHPMVQAVRAFIAKGELVSKLVEEGILRVDTSGNLLTNPKEGEIDGIFKYITKDQKTKLFDQGDAIVCWKVVGKELEDRTWRNKELQKQWMLFDAQLVKNSALCMAAGEVVACAQNHPRNIRRPGDGAKLISSNDAANFTFRGRFIEADEACTVGYETSHKAHNALRWLIARQGYRNGEQAVVAWAVSGARVPNPCEDFLNMADEDLLRDDAPELSADADAGAQPKTPPPNMGLVFAERLRKALAGYRADLRDTDGIAIMALDAASPGRLAVTFYREQMLEQYLGNLEKWQEDCAWVLPVRLPEEDTGRGKKRLRTVFAVCAPTPETIARVAYGRRIDDKLRKATVERLLPCVVDAAPLPRDIVECCVRRACNRVALEKWEWPEVLGVACGVYKGYYARHLQKEEYGMALDKDRTSRDYLYGRLLAVAEYIERTALTMTEERRPTNAERLMQRFADHPYATWRQLELQLSPYIQRLQSSARVKLLARAQKVLREIFDKFLPEAFISSAKLSGEFLLGYHTQMADLYTKTEKDNTPEENNQEGE